MYPSLTLLWHDSLSTSIAAGWTWMARRLLTTLQSQSRPGDDAQRTAHLSDHILQLINHISLSVAIPHNQQCVLYIPTTKVSLVCVREECFGVGGMGWRGAEYHRQHWIYVESILTYGRGGGWNWWQRSSSRAQIKAFYICIVVAKTATTTAIIIYRLIAVVCVVVSIVCAWLAGWLPKRQSE